jgi:pilus assembly protein CpaE
VADKSILLVDQNEASRVYLSTSLHEKEYSVIQAGSGKEALISAWRDNPDLILFDPVFPDISEVDFIQKLRRDARTKSTRLIAFSSDPAPDRREACMNAGVDEYIVKSPDALSELHQVLDHIEISAAQPTKAPEPELKEKGNGLLIVFLSAKGGTGTSSLCANLAMNIKELEPEGSVVVADLVLPIGSIAQIVGYEGELNLATVADLPSGQTNDEYFRTNLPEPEQWNFQLLAGSPDPQHGNNLKVNRIGEIVDILRNAYDFILLDLGRSLSRISLPLIQQADLIPLIVSTDLSTVELTKVVWEYLQAQDVDMQKIYPILNRAVGLDGLTKTEAEEVIGFSIKMTMPYLGGNFALANNLSQPITVKYPEDTASIIFKDMAGDIIKSVRRAKAGKS